MLPYTAAISQQGKEAREPSMVCFIHILISFMQSETSDIFKVYMYVPLVY